MFVFCFCIHPFGIIINLIFKDNNGNICDWALTIDSFVLFCLCYRYNRLLLLLSFFSLLKTVFTSIIIDNNIDYQFWLWCLWSPSSFEPSFSINDRKSINNNNDTDDDDHNFDWATIHQWSFHTTECKYICKESTAECISKSSPSFKW